jgi:hypothetical protein
LESIINPSFCNRAASFIPLKKERLSYGMTGDFSDTAKKSEHLEFTGFSAM